MIDVTVRVNLTGPDRFPSRSELEDLVDRLEDALAERTDNGSVAATFSTGEIELEVIIARAADLDSGFAIGHRIIVDSVAEAGIALAGPGEQPQWIVREEPVPA